MTLIGIFGGLTVRPTRFPELGYARIDATTWMFVDAESGKQVGPQYRTKGGLLADLTRYALESWGLS